MLHLLQKPLGLLLMHGLHAYRGHAHAAAGAQSKKACCWRLVHHALSRVSSKSVKFAALSMILLHARSINGAGHRQALRWAARSYLCCHEHCRVLDSVGRSCHFLPGGTLEIDDAVVGSTYTLQEGMEFIWYPAAQGE